MNLRMLKLEKHSRSIYFITSVGTTILGVYVWKSRHSNESTWIDWQYLCDAATLLAKCRYTLQYTYPYAYFMDFGPRKSLFEYQQAILEAEIENLSWKVERAETT